MEKIFKFILSLCLFLNIFFIFSNSTFAIQMSCEKPVFVKNKCVDEECISTKSDYVWLEDEFGIIENGKILDIENFDSWITEELRNNVLDIYDPYDEKSFQINWFCEWENSSECYSKNFKLFSLFEYNQSFRIKEDSVSSYVDYSNWIEYFFKNYNKILSSIQEIDIDLALWDIVTNLTSYKYEEDKHSYSLKNICSSDSCLETYSWFLNVTWTYKILKWEKTDTKWANQYKVQSDSLSYNKSSLKIWEPLTLNSKILVNKPNQECREQTFNYKIEYTYMTDSWEESEKILYLNDTVSIDKDLNQTNREENWSVKEIKINSQKLLEISIEENVQANEIWQLYFYFTFENDIDHESDNISLNKLEEKFNSTPVESKTWDPVKSESIIEFINYSNWTLFYPNDIIEAKIYLKDSKWNSYGDWTYWITVNNNSSNLVFNWENSWIKSDVDNEWKSYFSFSFSFSEPWNYSQKFSLEIPEIDLDWNLTEELIEFSLWSDNDKFNIRPVIVSEIQNLVCSRSITVRAICSWDDFSGCNNYVSETKTFNDESNNGQKFSLTASDNAGNQYSYEGTMDHIDRTAPNVIFPDLTSIKATDNKPFEIGINEIFPWGCSDIASIKYSVSLKKDSWNFEEKIADTNISNVSRLTEKIDLTSILSNSFKESWNYEIKVVTEDALWNSKEHIKEITVYPWDLSESESEISVSSNWDIYANNSDYYTYTLKLKDEFWNPIFGKFLDSVTNKDNDKDYLKEILQWESSSNWNIDFYLKSIYPLNSFNQSFEISMDKWWDDYENISEKQTITKNISDTNSFKKPIVWGFELIDLSEVPEIWKEQNYRIVLYNEGSISSYSNWNLSISTSTIKPSISWHFWNGWISSVDRYFWNNLSTNTTSFIWKIDANDNVLESPKIKSENLEISYIFWGKNIKYLLDDFEWEGWECSFETLWLKVYWNLQWDWKWDITGQDSNFSDLSKAELRSNIRKNAFISIKNRAPNTVVNWVKYVEWDISISWDQDYETLVVKNWNVIITWDLNTSSKKLWIIVLKDNYNVSSDYNNVWNIYISNSVSEINALIYADWAFRSADSSWNSYWDNELWTKLEFNGALFTRNTIGGAVKGSSEYSLPWWQTTGYYGLAEIYDLNYIRKVTKTCDDDSSNDYSFVITYDSNIQNDPPKLFSK